MRDVKCPYCGHEQDIENDDGYGYEEDEIHEQKCRECKKNFGFYTYTTFNYKPIKVPCFNGVDHVWKETLRYPWDAGRTIIFYQCICCYKKKRETETIKNDD